MSGYSNQDPGCCCEGCDCLTTICVEDCDGAPLTTAMVWLGDGTPATVNAETGCIDICLTDGAGAYQVHATASGYLPYSNSRSLSCDGTITIKLTDGASPMVTFQVYGCCSLPLPGATVTFGGDSYTTDSSGKVVIGDTDAGTYTWSVSKDRFTEQTGSLTLTECVPYGTVTVDMVPASGYYCAPYNGSTKLADPIPATLTCTDSVYGPVTLTYSGGTWSGQQTVTTLAGCGCPANGSTIYYQLVGGGCTAQAGVLVTINYSNSTHCPEPVGFFPSGPFGAWSLGAKSVTSFSPTIPFDLVETGIALTCVGPGYNAVIGGIAYPSGATFTTTE